MVGDIIESSWAVSGSGIPGSPTIGMSPQILETTNTLRQFLFERVYNQCAARDEAQHARQVIRQLYDYFKENEDQLPPEYRLVSDETERRVVDYIAGMTDQYALRMAKERELI